MNVKQRRFFDQQLQQVLAELPPRVHQLLDEVPLYVEDYPSPEVMRRLRVRRRSSLCGLYTGVPITQRSVELSGVLSDVIHIYREGIFRMAADAAGDVEPETLRREIRLTILHELGHHHGLGEDELRQLGY